MEIIKCKKTNVIVFILSLLFLMSACAFGQNEIERGYKTLKDSSIVVCKRPANWLVFIENEVDTMFVGIFIDSVNANTLHIQVVVSYPSYIKLDNTFIRLIFNDGSIDYLMPHSINHETGYVEYNLNQDIYLKMYTMNVRAIYFNNSVKYHSFKDDTNYFSYFLNNHSK